MQAQAESLAGQARLRDPAHRDQDGIVWRRGRFAERVRRQWNPVETDADPASDAELEALALAVQARVGGDLDEIRHRLGEFAAMDAVAAPSAEDPLVRPGAASA